MVNRLIPLTGILLLAALNQSCSPLEPSDGDGKQGSVIDKGVADGTVGDSGANLAAFGETLHPVLVEHCGQCHGAAQSPKFAVAASEAAFAVINDAQLVNPSAVPGSRLVARLGQFSHNCWSDCAADAKTMEDAIRAWIAKRGAADATASGALLKLGSVTIASAKDFTLKGGVGGDWVMAAALPKALGERLHVKEDLTSSQHAVLGRIDQIDQANPQQGGAYYFFDIPATAAAYQIWFRAKNTGDGQRVSFEINGQDRGDAAPYRQPEQDGINQKYVWIPGFVAQVAGKTTPTSAELKPMAGLNALMLTVPDTEADIDMIALTTNATFNQSVVVNAGRRTGWTFDLTALLGHRAILSLQYALTPDGKAYIFSRPTIETDEAIKIKARTLYVLVNGELNKQLSTFASTDVTVQGSGELNHGDMLVPVVDAATDTIELGFEELVVVP